MYNLDDLLHLMARLRDPQFGCPWDIKQTWTSLVPYTLEEAYEVADAIEQGDFEHVQGELGDLLFQVVYYSQLAREEGRFEFAGVIDSITASSSAAIPMCSRRAICTRRWTCRA
jgi:nucleoside triphosphate diphosphatase